MSNERNAAYYGHAEEVLEATSAYPHRKEDIVFIGFEGYAIDAKDIATMTSGFNVYTK